MEGIVIAITGTITAMGVIYKAYVELQKRSLDNRASDRQSDMDEFTALLQGYKDLKAEYEEQVKTLKQENKHLRDTVAKLETRVKDLERVLAKEARNVKKLEKTQEKIKDEIEGDIK